MSFLLAEVEMAFETGEPPEWGTGAKIAHLIPPLFER